MNGPPPQTAQIRLADLSAVAAAEAQQRQADLATRRASLDHEAASLRAEVLAAEASRNAGFSAINARIRDDDRHVAPACGLFADATAFMRLINPHSPLDVLRANDDRVTAARLLTVAEVAQARVRSMAACWQQQASVPGAGGVERGDDQAAMGR